MTNTKTKTQTQPQPFSAEQRKGIVQLLADARKRVDNVLESVYTLNKRIEAELPPKLAKEHGATSQVEKVQRLRKECKEAETTLAKLGFEYEDDCLSLAEDAPKELRLALEKAQACARKEHDAELLKYDKAILKVWAAQDAPEMMGIVEGLI